MCAGRRPACPSMWNGRPVRTEGIEPRDGRTVVSVQLCACDLESDGRRDQAETERKRQGRDHQRGPVPCGLIVEVADECREGRQRAAESDADEHRCRTARGSDEAGEETARRCSRRWCRSAGLRRSVRRANGRRRRGRPAPRTRRHRERVTILRPGAGATGRCDSRSDRRRGRTRRTRHR